MAKLTKSMLLAAVMVTLGAGAAQAAPRYTHVEHRADRDDRADRADRDGRERAVREWHRDHWVVVYEPVPVLQPVPLTPYDLFARAREERSEANRLRGQARWQRMFFLTVPADNTERRARDLDQRAAADEAAARAIEAEAAGG